MIFEAAFRAALVGRSAITDIVGQRVRYGEHQPESGALPDLYFEVANAPGRSAYGGLTDNTLRQLTVEIVVRSLNPNHVLAGCRAVVGLIHALRGSSVTVEAETGKPFEAVFLDDSGSDLPDDAVEVEGTTQTVYRGSVLASLMFRESGYET